MTILIYHGQEFETTYERIAEIRLGAFTDFTIYTELEVSYRARQKRRTKYEMSENRAKKIAFIEAVGGKCLRCWSRQDLTIDHVIPIVKGGKLIPNNLQILCRYCNRVKDHATIDYREEGQKMR